LVLIPIGLGLGVGLGLDSAFFGVAPF